MLSHRHMPALASAILAFWSVTTVVANPIALETLKTLQKRNIYCNPRFGGVKYDDCMAAYAQIPHDTYPMYFAPYQGDRPNEGLPYIWSVGECTISAGLIHTHQEDSVSWLDIASGALDIINDCVTPTRIGGQAAVGVEVNFRVMIYQFDYADEDTVKVGPDPEGVCAVKQAETEDIKTCVLTQAFLSHFVPPSS